MSMKIPCIHECILISPPSSIILIQPKWSVRCSYPTRIWGLKTSQPFAAMFQTNLVTLTIRKPFMNCFVVYYRQFPYLNYLLLRLHQRNKFVWLWLEGEGSSDNDRGRAPFGEPLQPLSDMLHVNHDEPLRPPSDMLHVNHDEHMHINLNSKKN